MIGSKDNFLTLSKCNEEDCVLWKVLYTAVVMKANRVWGAAHWKGKNVTVSVISNCSWFILIVLLTHQEQEIFETLFSASRW